MRYHLIAIGGSVMHNLAINLQSMGHKVSGSDDEIYEPSKSRLSLHGLLPSEMGWHSNKIENDIDTVILGKHARSDNPELQRAIKLGLQIMSFPEFVNEVSKASTRIVVAGSHGKTSTTSMIMHVMKVLEYDFDYLVGAQLSGFDTMVRLSGADILVVEGDEYPSSCLDDSAKMLHYNATCGIITGVAWDHVNIYKTYEDYLQIFRLFLDQMPENSPIYFDMTDSQLLHMATTESFQCKRVGYQAMEDIKSNKVTYNNENYSLRIFGNHNYKNLQAAYHACEHIGISKEDFLSAITTFSGASKRLERIKEADPITYKDFAHAPSKVKATTEAVRSQYPKSKIAGVLELHTFSSLQHSFIHNYSGSADGVDYLVVFYDPAAIAQKRLPQLDKKDLSKAINHKHMLVCDSPEDLEMALGNLLRDAYDVLLVMSSGNLGGINLKEMLA